MTTSSITAESRALIADISRRPVMDIVRGAFFIGILLLVWISLRPFADLSGFYVPTWFPVRMHSCTDCSAC